MHSIIEWVAHHIRIYILHAAYIIFKSELYYIDLFEEIELQSFSFYVSN